MNFKFIVLKIGNSLIRTKKDSPTTCLHPPSWTRLGPRLLQIHHALISHLQPPQTCPEVSTYFPLLEPLSIYSPLPGPLSTCFPPDWPHLTSVAPPPVCPWTWLTSASFLFLVLALHSGSLPCHLPLMTIFYLLWLWQVYLFSTCQTNIHTDMK